MTCSPLLFKTRTHQRFPGFTPLNSYSRYTHDANGNRSSMTEDGAAAETYTYDALNRLTGYSRHRYGYDGHGRRVRKNAEMQLYDGPNVLTTYWGSATPHSRILHGPGMDEPLMIQTGAAKTYLDADGQGSVVAASDAAGTTG